MGQSATLKWWPGPLGEVTEPRRRASREGLGLGPWGTPTFERPQRTGLEGRCGEQEKHGRERQVVVRAEGS